MGGGGVHQPSFETAKRSNISQTGAVPKATTDPLGGHLVFPADRGLVVTTRAPPHPSTVSCQRRVPRCHVGVRTGVQRFAWGSKRVVADTDRGAHAKTGPK